MINNTSQLSTNSPEFSGDALAYGMDGAIGLKRHSHRTLNLKGSYFSYYLTFNFYYMAMSLFSALISVYLIGLGYAASRASLVVSVSFLASMAAQPWIGSLADRYGSKVVSVWLFIGASQGGVIFLFCRSLMMLMLFYSLVMVLLNGANPMIEKMATGSPYSYGKIRIWGTIGAALGTQMAGYLYDAVSPSSIFVAFVFSMLLCIWGVCLVANPKSNSQRDSKKSQRAKSSAASGRKEKKGTLQLLSNRKYVYYLVVYGLFMGVTAAGNTFIPSLLTHAGLPASQASVVLSVAIMVQLPLVLYAGKFMDRLTSKFLLLMAIGISLSQNLVYGLSLPVNVMVGVAMMTKTIGIMLMIMINLKVVSSLVPASSQMRALAFAASINYLASILFNAITGLLVDRWGYAFAFLVLSAALVMAFVLVVFFRLPAGTDQKLFS